MPGEKRSKAQRLKDRETIARLRLRCRTLRQIADETGLSFSTVRREMAVIEAEWREAAKEDIEQVKARELQKLDDLEAEARAEWERSKQDWQKRVVEDKPGGARGGGGRSAKVETGGQCGDPRYLTVILSIQERRAKLLGTDKPAKVSVTDPTGEHERHAFAFPVPPQMTPEAWAEWAQSLKPSS